MELKWLARCSKSGENYRKTKQNKNFGIGTIFKGDRRNMLIFPKHFLRNTELYYISTASYSLCLFSLLIARSNQGRVWTTTSRLLEMCPVLHNGTIQQCISECVLSTIWYVNIITMIFLIWDMISHSQAEFKLNIYPRITFNFWSFFHLLRHQEW